MLLKKMKYRISVYTFIFVLFPFSVYSQTEVHKKALKFQELAFIHFRQGDTTNAREFAIKAIEKDSQYATPWVLIGNIDEMQAHYPEAVYRYRHALNLDSVGFPELYFILAELELKLKDFDAAIKNITKYLSLDVVEGKRVEKAGELMKTAKFRKNAYQNPVSFEPINLGPMINSENDEYVNSLSTNEQSLYLTIKAKMGSDEQGWPIYSENIYQTQIDSLSWMQPKIMCFGNDTLDRAGGASVSPNNRYLFFTICNEGCDLFYAKINGGKLGEAKNLGSVVNSNSWDSQPCFSSNGRSLFFASKRSGGYGGSDIWISELDENGRFTNPQNAGSIINTTGDEMAPLIHYDATTIYFSSNGHIGMGGYDLFMSKHTPDSSWSEPENLGYPVNTDRDEINLIVSPDGLFAYISSDQPNGFGGFDIYKFPLNEAVRPHPVTYIKGIVYDSETGEKLNAMVELSLLPSGELFTRSESEPESGAFLVALPIDQAIALNVNKSGYLFYSDHFNTKLKGSKADPVEIQIPLKKIKSGETMVLNNIFFETDKYELMASSFPELDKLVELLTENPSLKIEISGHTDNVGSKEYNQTLSEKRAQAVYDYLIQNHIGADRLLTMGYGESRPVSSNETEAGRTANRRIEFKIVNEI